MGKEKKKKRSRERSGERSRDRSRDRKKEKDLSETIEKMQRQIYNLTNLFANASEPGGGSLTHPRQALVEIHQGTVANGPNKENELTEACASSLASKGNEEKSESGEHPVDSCVPLDEEILDKLGDDPSAPQENEFKLHADLSNRWKKWIAEGLPEETKKEVLKKYPRKGDFYIEAPKVNLEIVPVMPEISIKRDQHFIETQNCVGSAATALGAAISMLLFDSDEGIDRMALLENLCDAGKLITDVFHQQSVTRKSFVSPLLSKSLKSTIETTIPDEWLYGGKFTEQVKEAKNIEKACTSIKASDKAVPKKTSVKFTNQSNWKGSPVGPRQVGGAQRSNLRFRPYVKNQPRNYQNRGNNQSRGGYNQGRTTTQTSTKKK